MFEKVCPLLSTSCLSVVVFTFIFFQQLKLAEWEYKWYFWVLENKLWYYGRRTSEIVDLFSDRKLELHEIGYLRVRFSQKHIKFFSRNSRYICNLSRRFRIWRDPSCIRCIQKSYSRLFDGFSRKQIFSNSFLDSFCSPCSVVTIIEDRMTLSSSVRLWELNEKRDFSYSIGRNKSGNFFRASGYRFS